MVRLIEAPELPRPPASAWGEGCGLYVHVPFCVSKCGYCDFHSVAGAEAAAMEELVEAILIEAQSLGERLAPKTVFIGGGTPTHLPPKVLERLLVGLSEHFDLSSCVEWTCEANPESTTEEKLAILRSCGVSRLSLGVQSFDDEALRFLERPHDSRQARRAIELAQDAGFAAVSIDLIHGLGTGRDDLWSKDIGEALRWTLPHLSCYELTIEPGTSFGARFRQGLLAPLGDEETLQQARGVAAALEGAGYTRYEISNYARQGFECQHNINYWRQGNYIGLGPGASKHRDGWRATNVRSIPTYIEVVRATGCAEASAEVLTGERRLREAVWLGLRLTAGVDLDQIERRLGIRAEPVVGEAIARGVASGLLVDNGSHLRLTVQGRELADLLSRWILG